MSRTRVLAVTVAAGLTLAAAPFPNGAASATPSSAATDSGAPLEFVQTTETVDLYRYDYSGYEMPGEEMPSEEVPGEEVPGEGYNPAFGEVGLYVGAPSKRFELRATRRTYAEPIMLQSVAPDGTRTDLGADLTTGMSGLEDFYRLRVYKAGNLVHDELRDYCPNSYDVARLSPSAADAPTYPSWCSYNPLAKGMVMGIDRGYASSALGYLELDLPDGNYSLRVNVTSAWAKRLGWTGSAAATFKMRVRTEFCCDDWYDEAETYDTAPYTGTHDAAAAESARAAAYSSDAAEHRTAKAVAPTSTTTADGVPAESKPNLKSLPAFGIFAYNDGQADLLGFGADVWNAGPGPMVVDGFRPKGGPTDIMDAYQQFYVGGKRVATVRQDVFEYHDGGGHDHWHYHDFAAYTLLDKDRKPTGISGKQSFCLAPTDAVDLTVRNAEYRPENSDLHSACGFKGALSLREVLPVGWGDTYTQYVSDQAFDITDLPNGSYFIQISANPRGTLIESNTGDNTSYRQVQIGGRKGARTAVVKPWRGIDTESIFFGFGSF